MGERLTKSDVAKIQEEIDYRTSVVRKEALAALQEAREQGDLSENFEYYAAKRDKNKNESRINYLKRMLKFAEIIDDSSSADEVGLNKEIEIYYPEDDETEKVRLVTSIRGDSIHNYISIESPIGKAILGHKVGDQVKVSVDGGISYDIVIRSISETLDDSNDKIASY